jgi:hypothetical protein
MQREWLLTGRSLIRQIRRPGQRRVRRGLAQSRHAAPWEHGTILRPGLTSPNVMPSFPLMDDSDAPLSNAALQALRTIALQVIGHPSEHIPNRWLFLLRDPASKRTWNNPGDYRLFLEDDQEDFTYVCGFDAADIEALAQAGLLTPCELETDPREHFVLNARGLERCRNLGAARLSGPLTPAKKFH